MSEVGTIITAFAIVMMICCCLALMTKPLK
jgi:hypothetical protein